MDLPVLGKCGNWNTRSEEFSVQRNHFCLKCLKTSIKFPLFSFLSIAHQKNRRESRSFCSDLSLKNRNSPLRVLAASKDKVGSHMAGVSGGTDSVGTTGSSGEAEAGPKGNGHEDANIRRNMMLLSMGVLPKHSERASS